jgi:hypothetical protein
MNSKLLKVILPCALAIVLTACGNLPVQNVDNAPITTSNPNYDLSDVTKAITRAGVQLGWEIKEQTPGHIVATLHLRKHVARVDITYTLDEFSINYKDSSNLRYDPSNNTIHKNYNGWIKNLNEAIDTQLRFL